MSTEKTTTQDKSTSVTLRIVANKVELAGGFACRGAVVTVSSKVAEQLMKDNKATKVYTQ